MLYKFHKEKNPLLRDDLFQKCKSYRNRLVGIMRDSKNQYYISYFNENFRNSKKMWEWVNQITNLKKKTRSTNISIKIGEKVISEPEVVSSEFNAYFGGVAEKVESKIPITKASHRGYLKKNIVEPSFSDQHIKKRSKRLSTLWISPNPRVLIVFPLKFSSVWMRNSLTNKNI